MDNINAAVQLKDIRFSKQISAIDRTLYLQELPKIKPMPFGKKLNIIHKVANLLPTCNMKYKEEEEGKEPVAEAEEEDQEQEQEQKPEDKTLISFKRPVKKRKRFNSYKRKKSKGRNNMTVIYTQTSGRVLQSNETISLFNENEASNCEKVKNQSLTCSIPSSTSESVIDLMFKLVGQLKKVISDGCLDAGGSLLLSEDQKRTSELVNMDSVQPSAVMKTENLDAHRFSEEELLLNNECENNPTSEQTDTDTCISADLLNLNLKQHETSNKNSGEANSNDEEIKERLRNSFRKKKMNSSPQSKSKDVKKILSQSQESLDSGLNEEPKEQESRHFSNEPQLDSFSKESLSDMNSQSEFYPESARSPSYSPPDLLADTLVLHDDADICNISNDHGFQNPEPEYSDSLQSTNSALSTEKFLSHGTTKSSNYASGSHGLFSFPEEVDLSSIPTESMCPVPDEDNFEATENAPIDSLLNCDLPSEPMEEIDQKPNLAELQRAMGCTTLNTSDKFIGAEEEEKILNNEVILQVKAMSDCPTSEDLVRTDLHSLKAGLCFQFLKKPSFKCDVSCAYGHEFERHYYKRLRTFPSMFITKLVKLMVNDQSFCDYCRAAFCVLKRRQKPETWLRILAVLIFLESKPGDNSLISFWQKFITFFSGSTENIEVGFTRVMRLFASAEEESIVLRLTEFIKMWQNKSGTPVKVTYAIFKPVLKFLPAPRLMDIVDNTNDTLVNLKEVYSFVVPLIPVERIPIYCVESLLKLSKNLETSSEYFCSIDLKRRLKTKVLTFTMPVGSDYPYTSELQSQLNNFPLLYDDVRSLKREADDSNIENAPPAKRTSSDGEYFLMNKPTNRPYRVRKYTVEVLTPNEEHQKVIESSSHNASKARRIVELIKGSDFAGAGGVLNYLNPSLLRETMEIILDGLLKEIEKEFNAFSVVSLFEVLSAAVGKPEAIEVLSSLAVTLALYYAKRNQFQISNAILDACKEKLDLSKIKIIRCTKEHSVARMALFICEIKMSNGKLLDALSILEKYRLITFSRALWLLPNLVEDSTMRNNLCKSLLQSSFEKQQWDEFCAIFFAIMRGQNRLVERNYFNLTGYCDDIISILINSNRKNDFVELFHFLDPTLRLRVKTNRAIIVYLARNGLDNLAMQRFTVNTDIYGLPDLNADQLVLTVSSCWLKEELKLFFLTFLNRLKTKKIIHTDSFTDLTTVEINFKEEILPDEGGITPSLLIESDEGSIQERLASVLREMRPPLTLESYNSNNVIINRFITRLCLRNYLDNT